MEAVSNEIIKLAGEIRIFLPKLIPGLIVFSVFWFIGKAAGTILSAAGARLSAMKRELADLMGQVLKSIFTITGAVLALSKLGININALVASLGLTGFALGFALRDILSNVLAGALIFIYRPFQINDIISVTALEGKVSDIDLRYTTINSAGRRYLIPNSILFNNAVQIIDSSTASH